MRRWICLASIAFVAGSTPRLERRVTIGVPARAPEIVAIDAKGDLLVHSDAVSNSVEIYSVSWDGLAPSLRSTGRAKFANEPTSVALHPQAPVAFAVTLGSKPQERGRLNAIDLREGQRGAALWSRVVGRHPDSVKVTRDGRYAITADEGQDDDADDASPGTVTVVELGADPFDARDRRAFELSVHDVVAWVPAGRIEPEFVDVDPQSRFAIVTCQENDLAVVVDLRGAAPKLSTCVIRLPEGAEPDGVSVLDGYVDAQLGRGALIAFAEEGRKQDGVELGQSLGLYWLGPEPAFDRAVELAHVSVAAILDSKKGRADPEGAALVRRGERIFAVVSIERGDQALLFEVSDARRPKHVGGASTGLRPEGLASFEHAGRAWFVTGDEGDDGKGPGEITFLELVE